MSNPSTEEVELASLMARVMTAPLEPLREHSTKIEKGLSNAALESNKLSLLFGSGLDEINQGLKKLGNKLTALEELPEKQEAMSQSLQSERDAANDRASALAKELKACEQSIQHAASNLEKLQSTAATVDQVQQVLHAHELAQQQLLKQGQVQAQAALKQSQQIIATLDAQVSQAHAELNLQLQQRFAHSNLQLQEQAQAILKQNQQSVATLNAQVSQAHAELNLQLQQRFAHYNLQLGETLQNLSQSNSQQMSKSFKWLVTLGILNLIGLAGCAAWILLQS